MIEIERAFPADGRRIAEIQVAGWQAGYRGIVPEGFLDALNVESRVPVWERFIRTGVGVMLVARSDSGLLGFCHLIPSRDAGAVATAEIAAIYVDPPHWREGCGKALVEAALATAAGQGNRSLTLWVLAGNSPGRRFYEAMGMREDGGEKVESRPGFDLHEVRYRIAL